MTTEGESWPSLGVFAARGDSPLEELQLVRARLQKGGLDVQLKRDIDRYLRRLEKKPDLLKKLLSTGRGRKRGSVAPDVALHYLVLKTLNGRGGATKAKDEVARTWKVPELKVRDAFTQWRTCAEYQLRELLRSHVNRSPGARRKSDGSYGSYPKWTEKTVLQAMAKDLKSRSDK